jgi:amidohydrolase
LDELDIEHVRIADTGVMGIIRGEGDGTCVGLRADIDALPLIEDSGRAYASKTKGVMHACGHDAHTAILIGCAAKLKTLSSTFRGVVKLFFQPAEETIGGAKRMVLQGCMKNPDVDYMLGLHVMPYLPVGTIEVRDGKLNAASDMVAIDIYGKAAHGAYPEKGIDAGLVGAEILQGIQTILTRQKSPLDQAVVTFGRINGGSKDNIICDHLKATGIMRTTDETLRAHLKEMMTNYVEAVAAAHGAKGVITFEPGYNALINDKGVNEMVRSVARKVLGAGAIFEKESPSLGVEDYSFFLDDARGAFYHLGCGNVAKEIVHPLHSEAFDLDERALIVGVGLQMNIILNLLQGGI